MSVGFQGASSPSTQLSVELLPGHLAEFVWGSWWDQTGGSKEHKTQGMRPRISRLLFRASKIQETAWWLLWALLSLGPVEKDGIKILEFGQPEALTCQACGDQARNLIFRSCAGRIEMKESRHDGGNPFHFRNPKKDADAGNHPKSLGKRFFFLEVLRI